eukprot:COSAG01_NODE_36938_length_510_cov_2.849148_2_plen_131_part_01
MCIQCGRAPQREPLCGVASGGPHGGGNRDTKRCFGTGGPSDTMQPSAMSRGGGSEEGDALAVPPPPWQQQQQQQQQQLRRDYGSASVTGSAALEAPNGCIDGGHPCCILWTPIHPITWFAPFVGHMGVCDS